MARIRKYLLLDLGKPYRQPLRQRHYRKGLQRLSRLLRHGKRMKKTRRSLDMTEGFVTSTPETPTCPRMGSPLIATSPHIEHDAFEIADEDAASIATEVNDDASVASAEVIRQVDRKFILVQAATFRGRLVLCIDQHAADERVRLEKLEEEIFGRDGSLRRVETQEHEPPLALRMNFNEHQVVNNYEVLIRSWGFDFECITSEPENNFFRMRRKPESGENARVLLHATPKVEKRVTNADDFRDFVDYLFSSGVTSPQSRIRPPVITRLLHSRACRSAIMFGDWFCLGQRRDLIEELKTCQLPFQCAHGRPSVVPLAEILSVK
ncbi:DNA mismatch repair protein [Phytophthora pseudosyringae]|uniref:DNA mismatch repair protein n=1 Tax=Phytophthora pseudosyringae TaxID=221518 RepID=A0A8T1W881_9STRA|nr:DNA mismatch repair protein [Phytophthora pseudosyringae]